MIQEYDLHGRVALITGAGRGIGTGIAEVLAEAGASLAINALTDQYVKPLAQRLGSEYGVGVEHMPADITNPDEAATLVENVVQSFGKIDILVNNLGDAIQAPLSQLPDDSEAGHLSYSEIRGILQLNLEAAIQCTQAVGKYMLPRGVGKIINISGYAGVRGRPNQTVYSAGKSGLIGFTRSLAMEWAPYGVQVNAIAPGMFPDEVTVGEEGYANSVEAAKTRVPLGRVGRLREVGLLALYLASPASDYMTGQSLCLDGGQTT